MPNTVYVTGIGIVSAMGFNAEEVLDGITNGKPGISEISFTDTALKGVVPAGEVKLNEGQLKKLAGISNDEVWSRTDLLGIIAVKEALTNARISDISEYKTGLISATSVGGMDKFELFFKEYIQKQENSNWENFIRHDCGNSTERIADVFGVRDLVTTISTACSSSANAIMLGARLIKAGILDRVIAGGTDGMSRFTLNGFYSLKILDSRPCMPFSEERAGLNLGEGAGFLILESEKSAKASRRIARITGYGNANDAFHQTASSPEGKGARMAMEKAFQVSGLNPSDISYINAHGTGTQNNDLSEGIAIESVFGNKLPPISSTKPFTGHTLGAAGGIEAVLSVLAIQNGIIFPNLNFGSQMKEIHFSPNTKLIENEAVQHVLSNSFGFGGNSTSLIISAV